MHAPRKQKWQEKFKRSGYLFGAILLHLILFFMLATLVIWPAPPPPPTAEFQPVAVKTQPPPVQPPSRGDAANNPVLEPQPVVVPVVTPPSVITTANSAFTLDAPKMMDQTLSHLSDQMARGSGLTSGAGGSGSGTGTGFGSSTGTSNQLSGYFYDLKQTPDREPTNMDLDKFYQVLGDFVSRAWDDSLLDKYYKSKSPLYTNSFAIPSRSSEDAPKAFHVENEVQASLWAAHYHAKVLAPTSGEYRFVGYADNVLVVKINGKIVLDAGLTTLTDRPNLHQSYLEHWAIYYDVDVANKRLYSGPAFDMDANTPVDMDVLIADDGGICAFYLLVEKIGENYEKLPNGAQKLPYFQLNSNEPPSFLSGEESPPYSTTPEPWQGVAAPVSADGN
jgi:hypothetical protein